MADARDFLFNSDYAQDQIVYFKEMVLTNQTDFHVENIPHELDFRPLVFGVWDNTEDYSNPKPFNALGKDIYLDNDGINYSNSVWVYSDATNIYVATQPKVDSGGSVVSTDFHIQLYAFEPPDSFASVKPTSNKASKFIFNTRYNYLKLKEQGIIEANSGQVSVTHALGYVPQVLAWGEVENSGYVGYVDAYLAPRISPRTAIGIVKATKNLVYFNRFGSRPTKFYYRIYYDEA